MQNDAPRRTPPGEKDTTMDGDLHRLEAHSAQLALSRVSAPGLFGDMPAYDARSLTRGGAVAHLVLDGQAYCLRITRSGKLILTK